MSVINDLATPVDTGSNNKSVLIYISQVLKFRLKSSLYVFLLAF